MIMLLRALHIDTLEMVDLLDAIEIHLTADYIHFYKVNSNNFHQVGLPIYSIS